MKGENDYWEILIGAARQDPPKPASMPFGFDSRVLAQVREMASDDLDWVRPLFRAAFAFVGLMMIGSLLFAYISVKRSQVSRESFMSDSMLSMSLSTHE